MRRCSPPAGGKKSCHETVVLASQPQTSLSQTQLKPLESHNSTRQPKNQNSTIAGFAPTPEAQVQEHAFPASTGWE